MITPYRTPRTGRAVPDSPDLVVSMRRGGNNRLPLLAMMVPLLLLSGMGLVGVLRQWTGRPPIPDSLPKSEIEAIVHDLTEQLTMENPEILSTTLQVGYAVQDGRRFSEWSVISRAGADDYLFRVNGRNGRVFAINRLDDISGQGPNLKVSGPTVEAGLTPLVTNKTEYTPHKEHNSNGQQAAESAARRYLPALGLLLRDINRVPNMSERSFNAEDDRSIIWTFTYFMKSGTPPKNAIKVSVDSGSGRLESFWNPFFSH